MTKRTLIAACLVAGIASHANALTLNYDEAVSGDISSGNNFFSLGVGVNVISGTVDCGVFTLGCDFDKFDASLPTGAILDSISLSLSANPAGNGDFANFFQAFDLSGVVSSFSTSEGGNFTDVIGTSMSGDLLDFAGLNNFPGGFVNDYTIEISVSAVPIPAGAPLLLTGLGGMVWLRRRKLKKA